LKNLDSVFAAYLIGWGIFFAFSLSVAKRAAGLECELEQMEGRLSQGEEINLDSYGRAASHLRRILESLGLERKARDALLWRGRGVQPHAPAATGRG